MPDERVAKLIDVLRALRSEQANPALLSQIILLTEEPMEDLSVRARLKLRRGNFADQMRVACEFVPACSHRNLLGHQKVFDSVSEHKAVASAVDRATSDGVLERQRRPSWIEPDSSQLGSDGYFACARCGAQWTLVEPERHTYGLWARIA